MKFHGYRYSPVILMLLGAVLLGCEKKESEAPLIIEKVEPLSYFPAFPNSWWKYNNGDTLKVAPAYETHIFNSSSYTAVEDLDTLRLPRLILNGFFNPQDSLAYILEHSISKASNSSYRDPSFIKLLTTTEGSNFVIKSSWMGMGLNGRTTRIDTSIVVQGRTFENVIEVIHYVVGCPGTFQDCTVSREYYAKDVGLIRRDNKELFDSQFSTEFELVDYSISFP